MGLIVRKNIMQHETKVFGVKKVISDGRFTMAQPKIWMNITRMI